MDKPDIRVYDFKDTHSVRYIVTINNKVFGMGENPDNESNYYIGTVSEMNRIVKNLESKEIPLYKAPYKIRIAIGNWLLVMNNQIDFKYLCELE